MADRLAELQAAQSLMWDSITEAPADKRAPLMAQWRSLEKDIAELESQSGKAGDPVDEVAARRAARGGATSRPGRTAANPR